MTPFEQAADNYWDRVNFQKSISGWRDCGFSWASLLHVRQEEPGLSPNAKPAPSVSITPDLCFAAQYRRDRNARIRG